MTQVMPLSFRTRWAEPTTAPDAMTFTEVKSWSAALGLCASNKIAVVNSNKTEKTAKKLFLMRISFADLPEPSRGHGDHKQRRVTSNRRLAEDWPARDKAGLARHVRLCPRHWKRDWTW